jgi:CRISPR/Cas system-associated protein Cas10 (large subunit of type III CRISPR-Cas system)
MATRKEKHARGLAKRDAFLEEERKLGQRAIEVAAKKREIEKRKATEKAHEKHYKFDKDCSLCDEIKAKQAAGKLVGAMGKPAKKTESPEVKDTTSVEEEKVSV